LALVNGRRMSPGAGLGATTSSSADINQIPADLIERVDVLTGGASAVYGADAVAGVVNFVLNTHFEGVRIDANYGFGRHSNNNQTLLDDLTAAHQPLPDSTVDAGFNKDVSFLAGANFADGKGNATVYATYLKTSPAVGYQYDFAGCTLNTPGRAVPASHWKAPVRRVELQRHRPILGSWPERRRHCFYYLSRQNGFSRPRVSPIRRRGLL
jgi:iron complex outermembrane receptor protein